MDASLRNLERRWQQGDISVAPQLVSAGLHQGLRPILISARFGIPALTVWDCLRQFPLGQSHAGVMMITNEFMRQGFNFNFSAQAPSGPWMSTITFSLTKNLENTLAAVWRVSAAPEVPVSYHNDSGTTKLILNDSEAPGDFCDLAWLSVPRVMSMLSTNSATLRIRWAYLQDPVLVSQIAMTLTEWLQVLYHHSPFDVDIFHPHEVHEFHPT